MKTNKNGISLVVLAITIIVMIILASAIILSLNGNDIIGSAKEATVSNDIANAKHVVSVAKGEWKLEEVEGYDSFKLYAEAKLQEAGLTGYNVSEKGAVTTIYKDPNDKIALIPEGYVASSVEGEDTIENGLVIYEGMEEVNDRNVLTARLTRNQFVWVPVEDINDFKRVEWNKGLSISGTTSYNMSDANEASEYAAMYESVKENKGFYIARYEAGKEGTDTLVSKKNATVWNNINWNDSKAKSETMSSNTAVGHLIYGEEWDAALNFISTLGVKDTTYAKDSTGKGWYLETGISGNSKHDTGIDVDINKSNMKNNIYDMAGNIDEWTMESIANGKHVTRGGSFAKSGSPGIPSRFPASYRADSDDRNAFSYIGFRLALYLR